MIEDASERAVVIEPVRMSVLSILEKRRVIYTENELGAIIFISS